ncbi:MAG: Hsp20/alpha crystallin family protein [Campylobacterota bacterium]
MLVPRFDPFSELDRMQKMFYNYPEKGEKNDTSISAFTPVVNTREDEKAYYIDVDLPGVKKEDINVDVDEGVLSIHGERNFKDEVKEEDYYKVETSFGKFQRVFNLPENVDSDNIKASRDNGVLEVTIPKKEQDKAKKKIEIK